MFYNYNYIWSFTIIQNDTSKSNFYNFIYFFCIYAHAKIISYFKNLKESYGYVAKLHNIMFQNMIIII